MIALATCQPLVDETIVLVLDPRGIAGPIVVVSGTFSPDHLLDVVEVVARAAPPYPEPSRAERDARSNTGNLGRHIPTGLVVASMRPAGASAECIMCDGDRWIDASAIAEQHGCELIEWFVVTDRGAHRPREATGEPARW